MSTIFYSSAVPHVSLLSNSFVLVLMPLRRGMKQTALLTVNRVAVPAVLDDVVPAVLDDVVPAVLYDVVPAVLDDVSVVVKQKSPRQATSVM